MARKKVFIVAQILTAILFSVYLIMGNSNVKYILPTMILVSVSNAIMLSFLSDGYIAILCFLNTVGAAVQLSMETMSIKDAVLYYGIGCIVGLVIYCVFVFFEDKNITFPTAFIRKVIIVLILSIFLIAFLNAPVSNKEGNEQVYGFVKGIAVYQFIIPLHMFFVRTYIMEDEMEEGIPAFLILHMVEFLGFFLSKEIGTLLILFIFSFVILFLMQTERIIHILRYLFQKRSFYIGLGIIFGVLLINYFVTIPVIGIRIDQVVSAVARRIFQSPSSQFDSARDALSITKLANPDGGFVSIYAAESDMVFISINMRFGFLIGILTLISYFFLIYGSTIHLITHETEEAQDTFMILFFVAISALIPIAGALQIIPFCGIPLYFLGGGGTTQVLSYCFSFAVIFSRRKELNYV